MTKRTGFVPAIIIIIAAIMVGAGIGGYFIWNKTAEEVPEEVSEKPAEKEIQNEPTAAVPTSEGAGTSPQNNPAPSKTPNPEKCPDGIWDEAEQKDPTLCPEDYGKTKGSVTPIGGTEFGSPQQQPPKALASEVKVTATGATYKSVTAKPLSGWFRTGQDADIMLSGIDFNNTGSPLLFNHPGEVATDGTRLLLADRNNNRVLIWNKLPTSNIPPDLVLGQKNFITNNPGKAADQMNWPVGVSAQNGKVAVADTYNDRILIWNSFPTKNGQPADLIIESKLRWPWDVWTDGNKLAVSNTGGSSVFLWNNFPAAASEPPDTVITAQGKMGTPRGITSNGQYLIVADHNNKAAAGSATFVWKNWPDSDAAYDFLLDGWRTGTFLPDNRLILLSTTHFPPSIWNEPPTSAKDEADLQLLQVQGPGSPSLQTGDGSDIAWADNRLYLSLSNGNKILVYNSIPQDSTQKADFAIGAPDIKTNTLETNFFLTNPIIATDGKSLFASSDFDKQLYVWKSLPDQSNAYPDFVYQFSEAGSWDSTLWENTLALAGRKTVYIWKNLPLNGELPNDILTDSVGSVQFQELHGVAMDNKYFYLADSQVDKVYVFEGVPDKNSEPKFTLSIDQPRRLSSDGKYLVVATTLDNQTGHIKIFTIADLSNNAKPKTLDRRIVPTNLPEDALVARGSFFIANTGGNIVYAWQNIEDVLAGKPYDTILGESNAEDIKPELGKNKVFWPAGLAFDGSFLWVGEFKFSGRVLRFSVK